MMKLCCIINKNVTIQNTGVPLAPEKLYLRFQKYVILNGNKTKELPNGATYMFQKYVILNGNKTIIGLPAKYFMFQKYVILNGNKTLCRWNKYLFGFRSMLF